MTFSKFSLLLLFVFLTVSCSPDFTSVEDAKKYTVGVWTGSEKVMETWVFWKKYEFLPDGQLLVWNASASQDDWGKPIIKGSWSVGSDKYLNTGDRYYYVRLEWKDKRQEIVVRFPFDGKTLQCRTVNDVVEGYLHKGDSSPFR